MVLPNHHHLLRSVPSRLSLSPLFAQGLALIREYRLMHRVQVERRRKRKFSTLALDAPSPFSFPPIYITRNDRLT